jgi:hypothetical protein
MVALAGWIDSAAGVVSSGIVLPSMWPDGEVAWQPDPPEYSASARGGLFPGLHPAIWCHKKAF